MRVLLVLVVTLSAFSSRAHIELDSPAPWFNDGGNKWCPCGGGGDGTRSNADCSESTSDPGRPAAVPTAYAPGEVVTLRFRETIGHTGRMRVAFDPDGADLADFNAHILVDVADPSGSMGNVNNGNQWELQVTLPTTPCSNCSLQLIQVMHGDTANPVPDPTGLSTYFQCAAITIAGSAAGEGEGEPGGEGEGESDAGDDAAPAPAPTMSGCSSTASSTGFPGALAVLLLQARLLRSRHRRA